jgi:hypothetical protein
MAAVPEPWPSAVCQTFGAGNSAGSARGMH